MHLGHILCHSSEDEIVKCISIETPFQNARWLCLKKNDMTQFDLLFCVLLCHFLSFILQAVITRLSFGRFIEFLRYTYICRL